MPDTPQLTLWENEARRSGEDFVVAVVQRILCEASNALASDVHFQPRKDGLEVRFRQDGVLHCIGVLPKETTPQVTARLKVLADLLTYKTNVPQEGRVRENRIANVHKEIRISSAPTLYGERVVVRFFAEENRYHYPDQLGLSDDILTSLLNSLRKKNGTVLITGPAGCGKTTTAYALLRQLADRGETLRSIVTLEDPVEHALDGAAQVEVDSQGDLSLREMIKYMMRQDPEVLLVGEIRDSQTADAALQAALTGHLLISTFHAGSAVDAVGRLLELGIEPYVLRSGISFILSQRLVRKLCGCAELVREPLVLDIDAKHYEFDSYKMPKGCAACNGTGYHGRTLIAEALPLENPAVMRSLLDRQDTAALREIAVKSGMIPLADRAAELVESGITSPLEVRRVLG
ncbi:general secretion pathway protein GspE [Planctomycetales bacterium]|nr:general secretion pathway protein GspE [Planctomycetales bacterium]